MLRQMLAAAAIVVALGACESTPDQPPPSATVPGTGSTTGGLDHPGAMAGGGAGSGFNSGVQSQGLPGGGSRGAAQVAQELVNVGDTVYFGFDSFAIEGESQQTLDHQAAILLKNQGVSVVIEGHCDDRGTREYNLALGERRATAVKDYLVAYGVDPGRIRVVSYGKERPVALGATEAAWAKNRRATTVVAGGPPAA
ncbi:MAG: peptidoglycan-associated lipoprotein Pal [Rhodospirillales bacterium]